MEEILDVANRGTMIRILNKGFNIGDMAYVLQDKGEMEIAMSTMLKNLSAHKYYQYELNPDGISLKLDENGSPIIKLDSTGNMIQLSAYDSLVDNGSGTPSIRIDSSMTLSDLEGIRGRTHQEYIMHQGNYSNQSQTRIESSIMGVLMMFFRKYLEPFIEARFKNAFGVGDPRNWVAGQAQVGWWVGFYRIFSELGLQQGLLATLPGFVAEKTGKIKYNRLYAAKAAQVRRELLFASIATFVYISLRALRFGDDDERKELSWAEMQGMRLIAKVTNESRSMVYVPYIGKGDEFINNFGTFTSAFNEGKTVFKLAENFGYAMSYELFDSEYAHTKGYYQKDAFRYEKGDPKVMANFLALTGVENILDVINPEFAVAKQFIKSD